jgi:hypothetical protein
LAILARVTSACRSAMGRISAHITQKYPRLFRIPLGLRDQ